MGSVKWSCPSYRAPLLCTNRLSLEPAQTVGNILVKDWGTGAEGSCAICLIPESAPPIPGCFCNAATRPLGLPGAMQVTFSSPIVSAGGSASGVHTVEVDVNVYDEAQYYRTEGVGGYYSITPADRRSRRWKIFNDVEEYAPYTAISTLTWSDEVPSFSLSELVLRNPQAYLDTPADKQLAQVACAGNPCVWLWTNMEAKWGYWHDQIYSVETKRWSVIRSAHQPDWLLVTSSFGNFITTFGYLPSQPPSGVPHGTQNVVPNPPPQGAVRYNPSPPYWIWNKHMVEGCGWGGTSYYYAVPLPPAGVSQPVFNVMAGVRKVRAGREKAEGSIPLTGSVWDLIYACMASGVDLGYSKNTASNVLPPGNLIYPTSAYIDRTSIMSAPDKAIGPVTNPVDWDSTPPDPRKYPVAGYPALFIGGNYFTPNPDATENSAWSGFCVKSGVTAVLSIAGRKFSLSLFARFPPYKFAERTATRGTVSGGGTVGNGSLTDYFHNTGNSSVLISTLAPQGLSSIDSPVYYNQQGYTWHTKSTLEEPGDYEAYHAPYRAGSNSDAVPPTYNKRVTGGPGPQWVYINSPLGSQSVQIGRWESDDVPCNKVGVIELKLKTPITLLPLTAGQVRVGPTSLPQFAYLDIGESGVDD